MEEIELASIWNFEREKKLENVLLNLIETGPKHLNEIAREVGITLKTDSDRNSLKYRMRKLANSNEKLFCLGYTKDGYIVPRYTDEYFKISKPLRSRGQGLIFKADKIDNYAAKYGKKREVEQIELFEELPGESIS